MLRHARPAIVMILVMTVITGLAYPLAVTGVARLLFPSQAEGSLISKDGVVRGSELIGQKFAGEQYFHPRPSAAGADGYDAVSSGGSNLGPTNRTLVERVSASAVQLRSENSGRPIPVDLVTTSGSGLDPHISPAAADFQIPRVARARAMPEERLRQIVLGMTEERQLGVLGEPRVNVLRLNLALDEVGRGVEMR